MEPQDVQSTPAKQDLVVLQLVYDPETDGISITGAPCSAIAIGVLEHAVELIREQQRQVIRLAMQRQMLQEHGGLVVPGHGRG